MSDLASSGTDFCFKNRPLVTLENFPVGDGEHLGAVEVLADVRVAGVVEQSQRRINS
jgi:hypothetical protein